MQSINIYMMLQLVIICIVFLIYMLLTAEKGQKRVKKRNIYSTFNIKTIVYILLAALGITIFMSAFSESKVTDMVVFVCLVLMLPFVVESNNKRIETEAVFNDVILYCSSMGMLLKQSRHVHDSLYKVKDDLQTSLADDVENLMLIIDTHDEQRVKEAMKTMETNYPFTCMKNLDLIIYHMEFSDANLDGALFDTYQDDVGELEKDVRQNKSARTALRFQYIFISLGSLLMYWWFLNGLRDSFAAGFETTAYKIINMVFIVLILIALFLVDRYFNANTTKE